MTYNYYNLYEHKLHLSKPVNAGNRQIRDYSIMFRQIDCAYKSIEEH